MKRSTSDDGDTGDAARPHSTPPASLPGTLSVERAVAALAEGRMVIVTDDADRENEGDLILSAATVTAEQVAVVVRHTTGIVCAPMPAGRVDALGLPQMVTDNSDAHGTAFTVTVNHLDAGTGVAAADRALTLRALADRATRRKDLRRPGHVFPLRAREGGVLVRAGHTEAAVDLLRLAGREPVGVIGEIVGRVGLPTSATPHNLCYLRTKQQRMGHLIALDVGTG
jgi:3,4-dihydroxy 2-butanone 4-phosphate synthase/GTP cyclohydrolase II